MFDLTQLKARALDVFGLDERELCAPIAVKVTPLRPSLQTSVPGDDVLVWVLDHGVWAKLERRRDAFVGGELASKGVCTWLTLYLCGDGYRHYSLPGSEWLWDAVSELRAAGYIPTEAWSFYWTDKLPEPFECWAQTQPGAPNLVAAVSVVSDWLAVETVVGRCGARCWTRYIAHLQRSGLGRCELSAFV